MQQPAKPQPLFELGDSELKELLPHALERRFAKGEPLWQEGDDAASVYIVQSGRVNMCIDAPEGDTAIVQFCTRAQTFCPAAAIAGRPYPCSAVAATEVKALAIPRSRFMAVFNRLPALARQLLQQMAPQVCEAHARQALSASPVRSRLASTLSSLHRRFFGRQLPFTRQELARMSGTTVETTIRTLSSWEKDGVISSRRGSIQVRQPEALTECAA